MIPKNGYASMISGYEGQFVILKGWTQGGRPELAFNRREKQRSHSIGKMS
jgi:hypothetical protein